MNNTTIIFACVTLLAVSATKAQEQASRFELTPFGGYAFGGKFEDVNGNNSLELEDDASFGLIVNIRESAKTQWEILYSRQETTADIPSFGLDVHYIHAGGTYLGDRDYARPYLAATIGATHFEPGLSGFNSETFFSFSIGTGLHLRPNDRFGIRLEARAFGTVLKSDTDLFCQTGIDQNICVIRSEGTVLWQLQTLAGFVIRF